MGRHIRKGVDYGGTVNQASMIMHGDKSVATELNEIKSNLSNFDWSQTSMEQTDFKSMIQQILNKVFPSFYEFMANGVLKKGSLVNTLSSPASHNTVDGHYIYQSPGSSDCISRFSEVIDSTKYSKITIVGAVSSVDEWCGLGYSSNANVTLNSGITQIALSSSDSIAELDVTNNIYLYLYARNGRFVGIKDIYLTPRQ